MPENLKDITEFKLDVLLKETDVLLDQFHEQLKDIKDLIIIMQNKTKGGGAFSPNAKVITPTNTPPFSKKGDTIGKVQPTIISSENRGI